MSVRTKLILILINAFFLIQLGNAQELELSLDQTYEADFNFPTDLCGNDAGDVFILDGMNDRVVRISAKGQVSSIKPQRDTFQKAVGIAWVDNQLWIADTPRSRLIRLDMNGGIRQIIELGHGIEPVDLVGISGNKAVSDRLNHSITVLDNRDKEKFYWGSRGNKIGQFINPGFLAAGPENRLVVADMLNSRVMSYSQSGRYPQIIAKSGVERGQIFRPKGVALDSQDRVWVVDGYTGALQAFSLSGKYLGVATQGGKPLNLSTPIGVWVDQNDRVWVVESYANKVSVWKKADD